MRRLIEKVVAEGDHLHFTFKDFIAYAGYPVSLLHLNELPFWDDFQNHSLLPNQATQRYEALMDFIIRHYQYVVDNDEDSMRDILTRVALTLVESCGVGQGSTVVSLPLFSHGAPLTKEIVSYVKEIYSAQFNGYINPDIPCDVLLKDAETSSPLVLPSFDLSGHCLDKSLPKIQVRKEAFVFLETGASQRDEIIRNYKLARKEACALPSAPAFYAFSSLHELRHVRQVLFSSVEDAAEETLGAAYVGVELDADLFAGRVLDLSHQFQGMASFYQKHRWAGLVSVLKPDHWIAPFVECVHARTPPPSMDSMQSAVREIRFRVLARLFEPEMRGLPSDKLNHIFTHQRMGKPPASEKAKRILDVVRLYPEWIYCLGQNNLGYVYSAVREDYETGLYTDPLARQYAGSILKAVHFINPDLLSFSDIDQGLERGIVSRKELAVRQIVQQWSSKGAALALT